MIRILGSMLAVAALSLISACGMSEDTLDDWNAQLDGAQAAADARNDAFWAQATPIAEGSVTPTPTGACPHAPPRLSGYLGDNVLHLPGADSTRRNIQLPKVSDITSELAVARSMLNGEHNYAPGPPEQELMRNVDLEAWWSEVETVLVTTRYVEPEILDGSNFRGGSLDGWIFTWSYAEARIVCAARVHAENGNTVYASSSVGIRDQLWETAMQEGRTSLQGI